jgi:hypothetical protein
VRKIRNAYLILIGNLNGVDQLGIPGQRWEENAKAYVNHSEYDHVDWGRLSHVNF